MLLHEIKKQVFFVGAYKWVYEIMKVEKKKKITENFNLKNIELISYGSYML